MTDRAAELEARIAARRARDLAAWQAAYDAAPRQTDHACVWCGRAADRMARDTERIGWSCERCTTPPEENHQLMTIPQMAQRYGYRLGYLRHQSTTGDLAVVRMGSRVYVSAVEAERWIGSRHPAQSANARRRWAR